MLVTFEGIDGCGKSTQANLLVDRLEATGVPVLFVREPGGTVVSEAVRRVLLDPSISIEPFAELLLYSAARAQLVAERIRPQLEKGHLVICDRFYDSSTAYQGAGRGLESVDWFRSFNSKVTGGLVPDRTYLIEVTPDQARARRPAGNDDRIELAGSDFFERVVEAYRCLAEQEPDRFLRIDGMKSIDAIHNLIWDDLERLTERRLGTGISRVGSSK